MGRPQVLSPIPHNVPKATQRKQHTDANKAALTPFHKHRTIHTQQSSSLVSAAPALPQPCKTMHRSPSISSLSSLDDENDKQVHTSSPASAKAVPSKPETPPLRGVENRQTRRKATRQAFVDIFSPVRAMRVARAGMKRKHGDEKKKRASNTRQTSKKPVPLGLERKGVPSALMPHHPSREASSSSLRRNMRAMRLSDREEKPGSIHSRASNSVADMSAGSSRDSRSRQSRGGEEKKGDAKESEVIEEEEVHRLLLHAPSWQLHRLNKTNLLVLHTHLGTWKDSDGAHVDLYTKQELVDGIVKARSVEKTSPSATNSRRHSEAIRRSSTKSTLKSTSSDYTDESDARHDDNVEDTDANDAAGEETEFEPIKPRRPRRLNNHVGNFGRSAPKQPLCPPKNAAAVLFKDNSTAGSSSSRPSRYNASPVKRHLRHAGSVVFAASSPIRTRARARHQTSCASLHNAANGLRKTDGSRYKQRTLQANADGDMIIAPDPFTRGKESYNVRETDDGDDSSSLSDEDDQINDDSEWEDAVPTSISEWRKFTVMPRQAKLRAQRQLHHALPAEDSEALVEEALNEDIMSMDDVFYKPRKNTLPSQSPPTSTLNMSLDGDDEETIRNDTFSDEEEESDLTESDSLSEAEVHASPTKIRRLRNGKIRLPTTPTAERSNQINEVDMDDAQEQTDWTVASLSKLRRDRLVHLCTTENLLFPKDATRAVLIDTLVQHREREHGAPASSQTERPMDSHMTVRPESEHKSTGNTQTRSSKVKTAKDNSPGHTQEEELNGLDLESLNLVDKEIPFSKLEKSEKIGSGGFKDVYVGKYHISKKTSKKVAIADIRDQLSEMDIKELTLLRDLKHENIVRFIGVSIPPPEMRLTPCMIVSELCANGDLYDYIRNTAPPSDESIFRIMLETARGLEYLHTRTPAIIHRDCKSTNVLVTRNGTAKINDFGLARVRNNKRSMIKSLVGTVNWQAVELWTPKPSYNEKVDVWSAAMTFWETLQWHQAEKKYPFQDMNEHQIYLDVGQKKLRPSTVSIRRRYGAEIVDLLDRMWDQNPKERPTMTQVCQELEQLVCLKKQSAAASETSTTSKGTIKNTRSTSR